MELLMGNEAAARGAWEAGVKLVSSYPGTPSTEITEFAAGYQEMRCEWASNEKVALETAYGAAMSGARALCCMKHVGLNVASDALFTAAYSGIKAGLVVIVADDPGMHSSQNEQDTRLMARVGHVPLLEPSDSREMLEDVKRAFLLSERFDTPVIVRVTTRLAHQRSLVEVGERVEMPIEPFKPDPAKYVMVPLNAKRRRLVLKDREALLQSETEGDMGLQMQLRGREIGVVCSGIVYQYVREALPQASTLKIRLSYPLPIQKIKAFSNEVKELYVLEELGGVMEQEILAAGIPCKGQALTGSIGELSIEQIRKAFSIGKAPDVTIGDLPQRPPVLCPGCPHRATFSVLKRLRLNVFGDIGCYTLGALPPQSALHSSLCMGAGIGMAFGAQRAHGRDFARHSVAVIGDSTFLHSGMTGLLNAVYNGGDTTVLLLDNRITAMTGHQPNPAMGKDIYGEPAREADLQAICTALGAHCVTVDPFDTKALTATLKEELNRDGVSVIIARSPCALLFKTRRPVVRVQNCRNCKACLSIGCPAILPGESGVQIDNTLCAGCGLCAGICPHGALSFAQEVKP